MNKQKKQTTKKNHHQKFPHLSTKKQDTVKFVEYELANLDRTNPLTTNNQSSTRLPTINSTKKAPKLNPFGITIHNNNRICSTRGVVVTFIITIILIIAAVVIVGIVFGVINSQNTSQNGGNSNNDNNNNNNNNQNFLSTISTTVLTSSVSIGSQSGSACTAYTTINDPSRNHTLRGSSSSCDNGQLFNSSNGGAWIRFIGTGGTTIVSFPVGIGRCGAFLTVWYNTTLPTTVGTMVNGTICIETLAETCGSLRDTPVVYCPGNFYVYFLYPLSICNARYCTA